MAEFAVGGPWDGARVRIGTRMGRFAWLNEEGRTYDKPGLGRALYRAVMWDSPDKGSVTAWMYAEGQWFRCQGCGAFHKRVEGGAEKPICHLCGN